LVRLLQPAPIKSKNQIELKLPSSHSYIFEVALGVTGCFLSITFANFKIFLRWRGNLSDRDRVHTDWTDFDKGDAMRTILIVILILFLLGGGGYGLNAGWGYGPTGGIGLVVLILVVLLVMGRI